MQYSLFKKTTMTTNYSCLVCVVLYACFVLPLFPYGIATTAPTVVRKDERWPVVVSEFGDISAVDGSSNGCRHLHFITVDPNAMFLPVYLYSHMVFYVNSGSGVVSWIDTGSDEYELQQLRLETGDVYALRPTTVFYFGNTLEPDDNPQDLQIYAIFSDSETGLSDQKCGGVYAAVRDLVLRFDNKVLQATLRVSEEVIEDLRTGGQREPFILHQHEPDTNSSISEVGSNPWLIRTFLRTQGLFSFENKKKDNKKKKHKSRKDQRLAYNIFKSDRNVENAHGWSVTVTKEQLEALDDTGFSVFTVNLTQGSMMEPHWNTISEEIAIVLGGQGMVNVVCPSIAIEPDCKSSRFKVKEGDVFVVPRYHPMAQMSFNNHSFVFLGFTRTSKDNPSQYLAGEGSILQSLDNTVLAESFDVRNTTFLGEVFSGGRESMFLECKSCAENEERLMEEEAERERMGGGRGRQEVEIEEEVARREEQVMRRRWRKAEEAEIRRRKGAVNGCY